MTDPKFTSILGELLVGMKDMHDWGIETGHVDQEKLRWTVMALQEEARKLIETGMSQRKAAKLLGVGVATINRAIHNGTKSVPKRNIRKKGKGLTGPVRDDDLIQEDCPDCKTPQEQWQNSLAQAAGDAIAMRAFWTRAFEEQWQAFEVTSDLVKLAKQASEEWDILATHLSRRFKNGSKAT